MEFATMIQLLDSIVLNIVATVVIVFLHVLPAPLDILLIAMETVDSLVTLETITAIMVLSISTALNTTSILEIACDAHLDLLQIATMSVFSQVNTTNQNQMEFAIQDSIVLNSLMTEMTATLVLVDK
jgi:hypothetical protein